MNYDYNRFNVLSEISTYANRVKALLPTIKGFEFLKTASNRQGYTEHQYKAKRTARHQIALYFQWLLMEFVDIFLKKYKLKMAKVHLVDSSVPMDNLEIDIAMTDTSEIEYKLQRNFRQYAIKEMTNLSDRAYQSFINAGTNFGSLRFVKECRNFLNKEINYIPNTLGEYCDPESKILYFLNLLRDKIIIKNNTINIRLAGDGTNVAKHFTVLNFTFGFLDSFKEGALDNGTLDANTALGNFILGKYHIKKECYADLKIALKELSEKLSELKEIQLDGIRYKIEFWLGGDLKFISLVTGINAASSNYPCPWCILHKNQFSNNSFDHSINRILSGSEYGQLHEPVENIIPDVLHMFMRITDKLERKLHDDIEELNNTFSNTIEGNANFELYVNFLELINIKKPYYKDKTTSQLVLRDLNGVEKKRLFERINLPLMFPELENGSTLNEIWTDFINLTFDLKDDRLSVTQIKDQAKKWLELFTSLPSVDSANDITPFLQAIYTSKRDFFVCHFFLLLQ